VSFAGAPVKLPAPPSLPVAVPQPLGPDETQVEPGARAASAVHSTPASPDRLLIVPRWSGDGWLLYRPGSRVSATSLLSPFYGASQAGAVVRYALAPGSALAPQAYLRASRALEFSQLEGAAGLSLRPLARVPVEWPAKLGFSATARACDCALRPWR